MNTHFIILVLNCILVQYNVRQAYLIQNSDVIQSTLYTISKTYPTLNQRKTNYGVIISKNKLEDDYDNKNDPYHNYKLGKLLGYPTVDQYPITKKDKQKGYYTYHIQVEFIKKKRVSLFNFVAKDLSYEDEIYDLLEYIKESLYDSEYAKYIKNIYIKRIKKIVIDKQPEKIVEIKFI